MMGSVERVGSADSVQLQSRPNRLTKKVTPPLFLITSSVSPPHIDEGEEYLLSKVRNVQSQLTCSEIIRKQPPLTNVAVSSKRQVLPYISPQSVYTDNCLDPESLVPSFLHTGNQSLRNSYYQTSNPRSIDSQINQNALSMKTHFVSKAYLQPIPSAKPISQDRNKATASSSEYKQYLIINDSSSLVMPGKENLPVMAIKNYQSDMMPKTRLAQNNYADIHLTYNASFQAALVDNQMQESMHLSRQSNTTQNQINGDKFLNTNPLSSGDDRLVNNYPYYNEDYQQYPCNTANPQLYSGISVTMRQNESQCFSCSTCHQQFLYTIPYQNTENNNVQRWLVDPAHPYYISPIPPLENPTLNTSALQENIQNGSNIPIRYIEAPDHVVKNKRGKFLSPEDALKRAIKSKKIPPLTRRNSLRSIFSDASSNLEIITELDEEINVKQTIPDFPSESNLAFGINDKPLIKTKIVSKFQQASQSRTNYSKLCQLIIELEPVGLAAVFDSIYNPISLGENLSKPQAMKKLERLKLKGVLNDAHWQVLFPQKSAGNSIQPPQCTVTSKKFSSILLMILLKNICYLSPPYPNGWDQLPLPGDKSLSADISRLTWYRKHVSSLEILPNEEFKSIWLQISLLLRRLTNNQCTNVIKKIENETQDYSVQEFYIQKLCSRQLRYDSCLSKQRNVQKSKRSKNADLRKDVSIPDLVIQKPQQIIK